MNGITYSDNSSTHVLSAESIPCAEYQERIANVRKRLQSAGLVGLISFGDCWRGANICYFTEFRPLDGVSDIANAIFFLGVDEEQPALFVSKQCVDYATEVTSFPVYSFDEMKLRLQKFANRILRGTLGLAGAYYCLEHLITRVRASIGRLDLQETQVLAEVKAVKSEREVALIRKASALTDTAMVAIRDTLADGNPHTERELALIADCAMLMGGAERTGYDSMVQAGSRSAFNLARPTDRLVKPGDLVMTDIGARYRGYVADGGRGFTYGKTSADKIAIVKAAASAVEAGLAVTRPGITASALNTTIQRALLKSGYERYSSEARGHGTGHGTGMDPEEEQPWIGPNNETILRENMVFTLKATITVPGVGGLRTERIVRLTATGCEPLDVFPMELYW